MGEVRGGGGGGGMGEKGRGEGGGWWCMKLPELHHRHPRQHGPKLLSRNQPSMERRWAQQGAGTLRMAGTVTEGQDSNRDRDNTGTGTVTGGQDSNRDRDQGRGCNKGSGQ